MPPEIIQLLMQVPIVAVFIWYSDRINNQFQNFLKEQREADRQVLRDLLTEIRAFRQDHEAHDERVSRAIVQMEERTKARA